MKVIVLSAVIESRSVRWGVARDPACASTAERDIADLAARARQMAGTFAAQARVAGHRRGEARARGRGIAAMGALAAAASLVSAAVGALPAMAPDVVSPQVGWFAAAAALVLGLWPTAFLAAMATGHRPGAEASDAVAGSRAATFASLGGEFGRAIASIDMSTHPDVARAVAALLRVIENESEAAIRPWHPDGIQAVPARRHQRIVPRQRRVVVRTLDGRNLIGTIADVSLSGVALTAGLPRVAVGDAVTVGTRSATVARLWDRGIAFEFAAELDPLGFDEAIEL